MALTVALFSLKIKDKKEGEKEIPINHNLQGTEVYIDITTRSAG